MHDRKRRKHESFACKTLLSLPNDFLADHLSEFLDQEAKVSLAQTATFFYQQPVYYKALLEKLLQHSAKAEEWEAKRLAKSHPDLILNRGTFTEEWCGQRKWSKAISPLMYTAWSGDNDLLKIFLKELSSPAEKEIALSQLKEVRDQGTEHGPHLSAVINLIKAYEEHQHFLNISHEHPEEDYVAKFAAASRHWVQVLGKAQLCSVVNLLQWYCGFEPLDRADFHARLARICNLSSSEPLNLDESTELGSKFAIYRGGVFSFGAIRYTSSMFMIEDLNAVTRFCTVRKDDLDKHIKELSQELRSERRSVLS